MRLDFSQERVLAIVAHPDDAELLCAGTLARAARDGGSIGLCILCRGDQGQPADATIENLADVRSREMQAAARLLQAELHTGEIGDGELHDTDAARETLVRIVRSFRPTLLLAHFPEDYHADHRAAARLAEAASWQCASNNRPHLGEPMDASPAVWWMDTIAMHGFQPHFYVDISEQVELKHRMLDCHQSQLRRAGDADFAALPELMRRQYESRGRQCDVAAAEAFRCYHAFKRSRAW